MIQMMICININFNKEKNLIFGKIYLYFNIHIFSDNNDSWHTGFVEIQLDEMVKCISETVIQQSNNQPVTYWIETESDKLAPP